MVNPEALRGIPFFVDLTDAEMATVAPLLKQIEYKLGETVFDESEDGKSLYIIKKGEVKACKTTPEGELLTLTIMKDGDIFGEMSFLDGRPRSASIVALSELEVFVMEKTEFEKLVELHPKIIYKLMRNIVFTVHSIVRRMNTRYLEMVNYMWGRKR